jgi:hypothetical protein
MLKRWSSSEETDEIECRFTDSAFGACSGWLAEPKLKWVASSPGVQRFLGWSLEGEVMSIDGSESLGSTSEFDVEIEGRSRCTLGCDRVVSAGWDDDAVGGTTVLSETRSLVVDEEVTELDAVVGALWEAAAEAEREESEELFEARRFCTLDFKKLNVLGMSKAESSKIAGWTLIDLSQRARAGEAVKGRKDGEGVERWRV